jgi:RNA polymerase sigma factor (sigma-70 family)
VSKEIGSANATQMLCHLLDQKHDNGAAILNLVERYVEHFSRRYCNLSFHEQQDIQQDIAVKLISHGEAVRNNCSRSWVYTVVRNQCINHVHKQANQLSVYNFSDDPEESAHSTGGTPSLDQTVNIELIERLECLQRIFDRVEAQETGKADIAIYTQYAFGLSYTEIARSSRRSVAAIGNRISLLKKRLKQLVKEYC